MSLFLVSYTLDGHRKEYVDLFLSIMSPIVKAVTVSSWKDTLYSSSPALFLMIEEDTLGFAMASILRAVTGRRTVGLLFRGREAAEGKSLALGLKAALLRLLKGHSHIGILSIVPFQTAPSLEKIASDWIYDPQMWDIAGQSLSSVDTELSAQVKKAADGRRIVVALGRQDCDKGFDWFARLWNQSSEMRRSYLFVSAGKVAPEMKLQAASFEESGGVLIDRFISDEELHSLYQSADLVWAAYAPGYNQASGILGRAVQYGVTVAVREDSVSHNLAKSIGFSHVRLDYEDDATTISGLQSVTSNIKGASGIRAQTLSMKSEALGKINKALGL